MPRSPACMTLDRTTVVVSDHRAALIWRVMNLTVDHDDLVIIGRIAGALAIGAMIGFERSFHGRPAGFRTHSLVCIASALLMIVTVYQNQWMTLVAHMRSAPTRPGWRRAS